ncbi:MAG TPA: 3-oxoacyl-ACP reductase [Segeticoccus sp.]|uniref:3-oxoacyl-ACP reductase n=1 Tax=Segeticoccus sp. TaxID=2706531 RepID=UPI002D805706|nr:3-oxoacyl-ACP reductase [Segeticoccus sp.]HET8599751.1 3-oxoacyl-ACP reductase [Segeticoccus sp.]
MSDSYTDFVNTGLGRRLAKQLGLPRPVPLRRYAVGQALLDGPALVAGLGDAPAARFTVDLLNAAGVAVEQSPDDGRTDSSGRLAGLVVDATAARRLDDLEQLRAVLSPALKRLAPSGRVLLVGVPPEQVADDVEASATQRSLEGLVRTVGKELRAGATANLLLVEQAALERPAVLESPLRFFLSARSAYVSGQPIRVGPADVPGSTDWDRPLAGQVAVVTGAARGIGAAIARVLARDGAQVVGVDVPSAGQALADVVNEIGGSALQLDITAADAGARIAEYVATRFAVDGRPGQLQVVVHNAGITRDKLLVNTDAERWRSVLQVNLAAELRINEALLEPDRPGGLADGGRIIGVSSTSGIGGNRGQANYATSKAGVIGAVHALAHRLADRRITVNAVAPGFIETEMTARMPLITRELGRRINSLAQGGRPVDVGETIGWFAEPATAGVTGQVLRVCGQSQLGA